MPTESVQNTEGYVLFYRYDASYPVALLLLLIKLHSSKALSKLFWFKK